MDRRTAFIPLAIAILATTTAVSTASATSYTVTGTFDTGGSCVGTVCPSLRAAISAANAHAGPDEIALSAGAYRIERGAPTPEDENGTGDLDVTDDLTIKGQGAGETTILGALPAEQGERDIQLLGTADLTLSDLTVSGGRGGENEPFNNGGAIDSEGAGTLTLQRVVVSGNSASGRASWGEGAGIFKSAGHLVVIDSALLSNQACCAGYGGAIFMTGESSAELSNVTIAGNSASTAGGAIQDEATGPTTLAFVTLVGNTAALEGGGSASPKTCESAIR